MAIFNIDYFTTLDRGYYNQETIKQAKSDGTYIGGGDFPEANPIGTQLTANEIGTTMAPDTYPIQELQGKIRAGAAKLEIAFSGAGKSGFGGRGSTPEVLGKREREEFRELSMINDVKVSTHATFGKQGLSGLTQQGFSEDEAQKTLKEINKAIEFAASATQGGAVVFHAGEWQRPIMDAGVKNPERAGPGQKERLFKEYDKEFEKAPIYLADERTGKITGITRDMKFYFPEEEFDPTTGMAHVKVHPDGTPVVNELDYTQALEHIKERYAKENPEAIKDKSDAQVLLYGLREQQLRQSRGQSLRYMEGIDKMRKDLANVREQAEFEEKIWDSTAPVDRWKLERYDEHAHAYKPRKDDLRERESTLRREIESYQSIAISEQERYKEIMKEQERLKPIEEVGIKRTADTLAKAGIKAMMESDRHKKDLKEAIYIAPENLFPDFYGSHADEMINIIQSSRNEMAKKLRAQGYGEEDAKKKAETHIKATLDTGHMNEWRQHFQPKTDDNGKVIESPEQVEKRFNKWYLDQIQKMVDKKVLGHIHLTDNWGYDDEHLTPGQGNTPTKEVVKMLEKAGFKDFITEVGSFNANTILPDTLAELGSPVYALGRHIAPRSWGQMRHGHFGYAAPPNYIVGAYAPSNEFRLWSEVPLE